MKYLWIALALFANIAWAQDCTTTIWPQTNLAKCISYHYSWDQQQEKDLLDRMQKGQVEIDIFEIVNSRCDIHITVFDPYVIEKQVYLDCTSNMLE